MPTWTGCFLNDEPLDRRLGPTQVLDERREPTSVPGLWRRSRLARNEAGHFFVVSQTVKWTDPLPEPVVLDTHIERAERWVVLIDSATDSARREHFTRRLQSEGITTLRWLRDTIAVLETDPPDSLDQHAQTRDRLRQALAGVAVLEPDHLLFLAGKRPNDPHFSSRQLWHLENTARLNAAYRADIDAPRGWALRSAAPGIRVAVIDSGVRLTHADLKANLSTHPSGVDLTRGGGPPVDETGQARM